MKKFDLGKSLQLLGNFGVIVGIIVLVYELNQNRDMMEAQTRHEVAQSIVDQLGELASNADLAELTHRARCGRLESEVEKSRYFSHVNSRLRYWEDVHFQYRRGLYDESEFLAQKEAWRSFIRPAVTQEALGRLKLSFSSEFVAEIDALLAGSDDLQLVQFVPPNCG